LDTRVLPIDSCRPLQRTGCLAQAAAAFNSFGHH